MEVNGYEGVSMSASCHANEGVTRYAKHGRGMLGNINACQELLECVR